MHLTTIVTCASVAVILVACSRGGSSLPTHASDAQPSARSNVGPVPGPGSEPADRANPLEDDAMAMQNGRRLFVQFNCSGCHGGRAGGGMGPSLRDADWIYGNSDADIFDSIAAGRAYGMPAWQGLLPDQEIWKLVSYIKSLRTSDEPDPPAPR
jgi:cytochrome c oxidase cbb3-type subunit III